MKLRNEGVHYVMDGNIIESVEEELDLVVIIQRNLKVDKQYAKAAKIANSVLGMIIGDLLLTKE